MREREIVTERPVAEREVVIDEGPAPAPARGGGGALAAIVGIVLVLLVGWFLLNALGVLGEAVDEGAVPSDVEANVEVDS